MYFDVVIVGSGLGGSACSIVLRKLGLSVALIERGTHPRFAIGESATPVMSKKMRFLGDLYDIPEFVALSTYDRIKGAELPINCGPKELFHYFVHDEGQVNVIHQEKLREFIVQTPEVDAQYLRSNSDEFMVNTAIKYGVDYLDKTAVESVDFGEEEVSVIVNDLKGSKEISCKFFIDATGFKSILGDKFDLKISGDELNTPLKSRSIFTHFDAINDFEGMLKSQAEFVDLSPVSRRRATQHHCFDGGWLWVIPFDSGRVSVGVNLDIDKFPLNDKQADVEFWEIISRYPIIAQLLEGKKSLMPFIKTGRMQFVNREMVGDRWAMLPASAYGLDAWFSTGLASAFIAIHRIAVMLKEAFARNRFSRDRFLSYEYCLKREYFHVAKMIDGMYKSFKHYDVFKNYCAICFMGAEGYLDSGGIKNAKSIDKLLLSAGDEKFCSEFEKVYEEVIALSKEDCIHNADEERIRKYIVDNLASYNFRRFGDEEMRGVHPRVNMFVNV